MTEEEHLRDQLDSLNAEYREKARLIIDRLTQIEAAKPRMPPVIVLNPDVELNHEAWRILMASAIIEPNFPITPPPRAITCRIPTNRSDNFREGSPGPDPFVYQFRFQQIR